MKKVIINIGDLGQVKIEAQGFKDSSCLSVLKIIQESLGDELESRLKPEARISTVNKQEVNS